MVDPQIREEITKIHNEFQRDLPIVANSTLLKTRGLVKTPERLKHNMGYLVNHLAYISDASSCRQLFVETVWTLGTWPMRIGYSNEWFYLVDIAYHYAEEDGLDDYKGRLTLLKSKTAFSDGQFDRSLEFVLNSIHQVLQQQEPITLAQALSHATTIYLYKEMPQKALLLIKDTESTHIIDEKSAPLARLYLALAYLQIYRRIGELQKAQNLIKQIESHVLAQVDLRSAAVWYHNVGLTNRMIGKYDEAFHQHTKSREIFAELHDDSEIGIIADIGLIFWEKGDLNQAIENLSIALERAKKNLEYIRILKIESHLMLAHLAKRNLRIANSLCESALKKANSIQYSSDIARIIGNRGILRIHLNDFEGAFEDLSQYSESSIENNRQLASVANLARLQNIMGKTAEAISNAEKLLALAKRKKYLPIQIIALRLLAECSESKVASPLLKEASTLSEGFRDFDHAACLISLASLAQNDNDKDTYWKQGQQLLEKIDAGDWLREKTPNDPPLLPLLN
ncbi:MAG: hypothetical protein WBC91_17785 [Phototrophicaceae bacterium]